jgi:transcriptional regulator with XRE-family HTH domain
MAKPIHQPRDPESSAPSRHDDARPDAAASMRSLGAVIRQARRQSDLTLVQVAQRTKLSVSYLSQVERDRLTPSVSALKRIADVLQIPAGSLMFGGDSRGPASNIGVVRRESRKRVAFPDSNITYELLTPDLQRRTSLLWLSAAPGAASGAAFAHEGEDGVIVLEGRLQVEVGGVWHELSKGDSIYFNSELPHRWKNEGDQTAEAIWVSTPPSF